MRSCWMGRVMSGRLGFRSRWVGVGAVLAVVAGGGGLLSASACGSAGASSFVPITPCRLMDTRPGGAVGPSPLRNGRRRKLLRDRHRQRDCVGFLRQRERHGRRRKPLQHRDLDIRNSERPNVRECHRYRCGLVSARCVFGQRFVLDFHEPHRSWIGRTGRRRDGSAVVVRDSNISGTNHSVSWTGSTGIHISSTILAGTTFAVGAANCVDVTSATLGAFTCT